jgi:hypothetical protein
MSPLPHFFDYEISSLVRVYAVWNNMTVGKAFYKPTYHSFGKRIALIKENPNTEYLLQEGQNTIYVLHNERNSM